MFRQQGKASRATIITLVSMAVLISLAILFLPSGFSNDIAKIGKGNKVAVFAFNHGTTNSMAMMNLLDQIRSSYSNQLEFLAVSVNAPIGKKFLKDFNVEESNLILFNGDGAIAGMLYATKDEQLVRQTLDNFIKQ
ncbi:MAG: hypothetical protein ACC653_00690 [Gammaproteobacteria bacterium]